VRIGAAGLSILIAMTSIADFANDALLPIQTPVTLSDSAQQELVSSINASFEQDPWNPVPREISAWTLEKASGGQHFVARVAFDFLTETPRSRTWMQADCNRESLDSGVWKCRSEKLHEIFYRERDVWIPFTVDQENLPVDEAVGFLSALAAVDRIPVKRWGDLPVADLTNLLLGFSDDHIFLHTTLPSGEMVAIVFSRGAVARKLRGVDIHQFFTFCKDAEGKDNMSWTRCNQ
jgi:hypothetical protein